MKKRKEPMEIGSYEGRSRKKKKLQLHERRKEGKRV
jgi:hypothetical protein